jgi:hypothetical protein
MQWLADVYRKKAEECASHANLDEDRGAWIGMADRLHEIADVIEEGPAAATSHRMG